jgi:GH15 family glucan-1,4-alpha-glucosidase
MSFQPIENYGVIGNMRSIALVGMDGSIDFLCYPEFDSPTVFAALLDDKKGGRFQIEPQLANARVRQLYLPETNILMTRFLAEEGVAELTDYMPIEKDGEQPNEIVRTVAVIRGNVHFKMRCQPRFNYATSAHRTEISHGCAMFFPDEDRCSPMALYSTCALEQQSQGVTAEFTLQAGVTATFVLGGVRPQGQQPEMELVGQRFQETAHFWKSWIAKSKYKGRWREMVQRSALMLKLLISREHGSLIAAPTFSLPENIGGGRNWDYRFTWLRDATFTLYALIRLGFVEEAEAFISWLKGRLGDDAERGPLQVMYGIDGRQKLDELALDHLSGYQNSRRALESRLSAAAVRHLRRNDGLSLPGEQIRRPISMPGGWMFSASWVAGKTGVGLTKEYGGRGERKFLHSRVMCWVAFDRALRLAQKRSLSGPLDEWQRTRDEIRNNIFTDFWNERLQSFVQAKGTEDLDASALLMPMVRFISPVDPMWLSTMRAIENRLIEDTLVRRYEVESTHVDGLPGGEGSFTACSFWYVECLARAGELEKAQLLFEKLLGYANHLGLYSEELGSNGQHLGNFPQAFTHLALISAATYLDRALSGTDETTWR